MKFNLSHLRKLSSDKDYTVLQHPSGHEIKISHRHLQPKFRGELEAIPMADGGEAQPVPEPKTVQVPQDAPIQAAAPENDLPQAQPEIPQEAPLEAQPQSSFKLPETGVPNTKNDPYGTQAYLQNYGQGLNESKQGIEQQANAESQQSKESATALDKQAQQLQTMESLHNENLQKLNNERSSLMQDALQGHINPNQFWEDKSLPGKVSTIVGLIIGGLGGSDAPLKLLQTNIDRNIQAQKMNLENKYNLLNANRVQFQNERDALDMTRVMTMDQVSNQLKLAATKATDPMAKARALQAAGQLDMQSAPIVSQMALRRSMLSGQKNGQLDPETIIRFSPVLPEPEKEAAFKELASMQNMNKSKSNLLGGWDKFNELNSYGKRIASPLQTSSMMGTIEADLGQLAKDSEGRVTEADVGYLKTQLPRITDDKKTRDYKRTRFNNFISEKMNFPRLKSIGIDPQSFGRFDTQGQTKIQESPPKVK